MSSADVFALSIHADYRCRHSGACCSADWDVPIELPVYRTLKQAVAVWPSAAAGVCQAPGSVRGRTGSSGRRGRNAGTNRGGGVRVPGSRDEVVHRAPRPGRAVAAGHLPVFSPARCSRRPRHVHHACRTSVRLPRRCCSATIVLSRLSPGRMRSRPATTRVLSSLVTTCHRCCRRRC